MKKPSIRHIGIVCLTVVFFACLIPAQIVLGANWAGVDESVVGHYAEKAGRPAQESFVNADQGDLLLFAFFLAGTIGGFVVGYFWRILFKARDQDPTRDSKIKSEH